MPNTPMPNNTAASMGLIQWIDSYAPVHPNQNMAITNAHAVNTHSSNRFSGDGAAGAILAA